MLAAPLGVKSQKGYFLKRAKFIKNNTVQNGDEDDDQMTPHITLRLVHDDGV